MCVVHLLERARMSFVIAVLQIDPATERQSVRHASVILCSLCVCAWASAQADFNDHKALKRSHGSGAVSQIQLQYL